jgi:antitoxin (DNA-binding transcriptional repressor) of toxin-antitoxin stability system
MAGSSRWHQYRVSRARFAFHVDRFMMVLMAHYSIVQAQDRLSELVQRALAGEDMVISREDALLLLRLMPGAPNPRRTRQPGSAKGADYRNIT